MTQWQVFPRSKRPCPAMLVVVEVFQAHESAVDSAAMSESSNAVLAIVAPDLRAQGFTVEAGKQKNDEIEVPVLFGLNGRVEKSFLADAFHEGDGVVLEVEAGRGVVNNQFLKDLFHALAISGISARSTPALPVQRWQPLRFLLNECHRTCFRSAQRRSDLRSTRRKRKN